MKLTTLVLLSLTIVTVLAGTPPTQTPEQCRLGYIGLGNGLTFSATYDVDGNWEDYFCSCIYETDWTNLTLFPKFSAAQLLVQFTTPTTVNPPTSVSPFVATGRYNLEVGSNIFTIIVSNGCTKIYTIKCDREEPDTEPSTQGDPQFTGMLGQSYQIHGIDGHYYNIISDEKMQLNAKFVFLSKGSCPVIDGNKQQTCWTHPGQYLGEVGLQTVEGDKLQLVSGPANTGFKSVTLNGQNLDVGDVVTLLNGGRLMYNHTHLVTVSDVSTFDLQFENSDMFINEKLAVNDWSNTHSHGLLGQTWNKKTYPNNVKYVQGSIEDYAVDHLFGNNFLYNQFQPQRK